MNESDLSVGFPLISNHETWVYVYLNRSEPLTSTGNLLCMLAGFRNGAVGSQLANHSSVNNSMYLQCPDGAQSLAQCNITKSTTNQNYLLHVACNDSVVDEGTIKFVLLAP